MEKKIGELQKYSLVSKQLSASENQSNFRLYNKQELFGGYNTLDNIW